MRFLSQEQTRDLIVLAERARQRLRAFAGHQVAYGVEAMQLLDEWIDDYLEHSPDPPSEVRLLWTSLLGEMFRRRHDGWWALRQGTLVIVCPMDDGERHLVTVREQVDRRIARGMADSLSYFYDATRIELKLGCH